MEKDKSTVLLSIFKRKGSEGVNTRIIDERNKVQYANILSDLEPSEKGLIICYWDEFNWTMLTNKNLRLNEQGSQLIVLNSQIVLASPALEEEYRKGVTNKLAFTLMSIKDNQGNKYLLELENGAPYEGFYQVLHNVASSNSR